MDGGAQEWVLYANESGAALPVTVQGEVYAQNRFDDGMLESDGYVIIRKSVGQDVRKAQT